MNFKSAASGGLTLAFAGINSDNYCLGRTQFLLQDILLLFGSRNWYYANCSDNKGAINSEASIIIICCRCPELDYWLLIKYDMKNMMITFHFLILCI